MEEEIKEEKEEPKKQDKKKLIIIISIVVGIILIITVFLLLKGNGNKGTKKTGNGGSNTQEESDPELVEDTRKRIPRTENVMTIYLHNKEFVEDAYCDEACIKESKAKIQIDIEKQDAKMLDYSPKGEYKEGFPDFILYQDGDKIKYFNVSEFSSKTSGLKPDYIKYSIIENNKQLEAIYFKNKKENGVYSIISQKSLYINKYDSFDSLVSGLIEGIKNDKEYVLSLAEEKVIENADIEALSKLNKVAEFYVKSEVENNQDYYTIYSASYNVIASKIKTNLTYFENDTVYYIKDKKVYGYDNKGTKKYESKVKSDDIVLVTKGYYVSINNNKFELRDLQNEDRVLFKEAEGYSIDYTNSGYKDKGSYTGITGNGIYLVFKKEVSGKQSIIEAYYNPDTKISKVETIEK